MSNRAFDYNWGTNTQVALDEYLRLVKRLTDSQADKKLGDNELDKIKSQIQKARDDLEWYQLFTRRDFHNIFHRLEKIETQELKEALRRYREYLQALPTAFVDPDFVQHREEYSEYPGGRRRDAYREIEPPVPQQRRFLEKAIHEMESALANRGGIGQVDLQVDLVAEQIKQRVLVEARLRERCEQDVQQYPDQEETIRRSYRKAIDALREQA